MLPEQADFVFKVKADFLRSLAHPVRLKIIEHLKEKGSSVNDMVKALGVEQSNLSKHLLVLKQVGIVAARQEGSTVFYTIKDKEIFQVFSPISHILRKNMEESQELLAHLGKE